MENLIHSQCVFSMRGIIKSINAICLPMQMRMNTLHVIPRQEFFILPGGI